MRTAIERILIVSHDSGSRDVLRQAAERLEIEVLEAESGEQAVSILERSLEVPIAVVDLELGDAGGAAMIEKLRSSARNGDDLSVIGLAPIEREDLFDAAMDAGVDDVICRPLPPSMARAKLEALAKVRRIGSALHDQMGDLDLILDLTRRLAGALNIDDILFELVSRVAGNLGIDRCSLVLADESFEHGLVVAASDDSRLEDLSIDLTSYPEIQEVLHSGEPLVIREARGHPLLSAVKDTLAAKNVGALAVLPLQHHEEPMGVMFLRASSDHDPFSDRVVRVSRTIAHITAVALRNAELFQRARQQSAKATADKESAEREVADLRQIEAELRKTTDLLENLIDSSANAVVAADMQGRIKVWNESAEKLLGYTREEALTTLNVADVYYEDARKVMAALRGTDGGGAGRLEEHPVHTVSRDGERIPVTLSASILYEDGQEVATVGILTDMRDKLQIEEKLSRAQDRLMRTEKQMMIAELAGTTAHELNQPLTSVMGYAELLKRRIAPNDPSHRAIEIIFRESERMAEIVRKIGRITRYETKDYLGKTRIVDLDRSAEDSE